MLPIPNREGLGQRHFQNLTGKTYINCKFYFLSTLIRLRIAYSVTSQSYSFTTFDIK